MTLTSWTALLVMLGGPLVSLCVARLQDHLELRMILRDAPPRTVVRRDKLVVRVGDGRGDR